jgi:hypothetical protein
VATGAEGGGHTAFVAVWDPWAQTVKMGMVTRGGRSGFEERTTAHWTSGRP